MIPRAAVIAEALTWLGTPYVHQARLKGVGVDCVGLVIGIAHALGISDYDTAAYTRQPDPRAMRAALDAHLEPVPFAAVEAGDVLWFRVDRDPQHLAIVTKSGPAMMIHAFGRPGVMQVVETRVDAFWRRRVSGAYRFPGVA